MAEGGGKELPVYKVALCGKSGVGKTPGGGTPI